MSVDYVYYHMIVLGMPNKDTKGGEHMKMERVLIQLPTDLKAKLDSLRRQGYTASGFIRAMLEKELNQPHIKKGA